jgi:hypothetical protein
MITKAIHPRTLDNLLFVIPPRIFLSLAILIMTKSIGTATIPLITAVLIKALIGSIFVKFIHKPITVDAAIIR